MLKILELYPTSLRQLGRSSVTVGQNNLFQFVHKNSFNFVIVTMVIVADVDECASNPCRNNGRCVDGFKSYTCVCPYGYVGINCEKCRLFLFYESQKIYFDFICDIFCS